MSDFAPRHGIVAGIDGSPSSKVAVDWAARTAALREVLLTIVYIGPSMRTWPGRSASPEIEKRYAEQGEELLGRARHIAGQASDTIELRSEMFTGTPFQPSSSSLRTPSSLWLGVAAWARSAGA